MANDFLVLQGLLGGILIGLAAALLLYGIGRIAGISGILGGLIKRWDATALWRAPFVVGIPVGAALVWLLQGAPPEVVIDVPGPVVIAGGLLVGFGTRLGSGCTSGHGVCGLARLSGRSLVATATFMGVAVVTVFIVRHVVGG